MNDAKMSNNHVHMLATQPSLANP